MAFINVGPIPAAQGGFFNQVGNAFGNGMLRNMEDEKQKALKQWLLEQELKNNLTLEGERSSNQLYNQLTSNEQQFNLDQQRPENIIAARKAAELERLMKEGLGLGAATEEMTLGPLGRSQAQSTIGANEAATRSSNATTVGKEYENTPEYRTMQAAKLQAETAGQNATTGYYNANVANIPIKNQIDREQIAATREGHRLSASVARMNTLDNNATRQQQNEMQHQVNMQKVNEAFQNNLQTIDTKISTLAKEPGYKGDKLGNLLTTGATDKFTRSFAHMKASAQNGDLAGIQTGLTTAMASFDQGLAAIKNFQTQDGRLQAFSQLVAPLKEIKRTTPDLYNTMYNRVRDAISSGVLMDMQDNRGLPVPLLGNITLRKNKPTRSYRDILAEIDKGN